MEYQIISTIEEFASIRVEWEKIEKSDPDTMFFMTFEYRYTWWEVYNDHPDYNLFIICVKHNNEIVGIAPFVLKKSHKGYFSYTSLMFLGDGDYKDFVIAKNKDVKLETIYKTIFEAINENDNSWDEIFITHISQNSQLSGYLLKSEYNKYFSYLTENPYINFDEFESYEDYCKKFLPSNINRLQKKISKSFKYSLSISNNNMIEAFSKIHIAEKNYHVEAGRINRHSIFEDERKYLFRKKLFASSSNVLNFYLTQEGSGKILAYCTGVVYGNIFVYTNSAYLPEYSSFGLGRLLFYSIFEHLYNHQTIRIFDFGTGRYSWKFEWTNRYNFNYKLNIINSKSIKLRMYNKIKNIKKAIKE